MLLAAMRTARQTSIAAGARAVALLGTLLLLGVARPTAAHGGSTNRVGVRVGGRSIDLCWEGDPERYFQIWAAERAGGPWTWL